MIGFKRLATIARPLTCSTSSAATTDSGAIPVVWLGTMWPNFSNQKFAIWFSTRPFSGIGSDMMTSKADKRSEVTIRILSSPTA
jgi:hypothetical protein